MLALVLLGLSCAGFAAGTGVVVGSTEAIILDLKNNTFLDTYQQCSKRTKEVSGCKWMDKIAFETEDPLSVLKSVPFAYALEYRCESKGIGMIAPNGKVQDKVSCTTAITSKIDASNGVDRDGYLRECECYEECQKGIFKSKVILIEDPTAEEKAKLTKEELEQSIEVYTMEMCARRCAWPDWTDKNEVEWDTKIYKYFCEKA